MTWRGTFPSTTLARALAVAVLALGIAACKPTAKLVVRVKDQAGMPIAGVTIAISDIPNSVGSTFTVSGPTGSDGSFVYYDERSGKRTVTVTPPAGYGAGDQSLVTKVLLSTGNPTVEIEFVLKHL